MKYRKKPVVIDAVRFDGQNFDEIIAFCAPTSVKVAVGYIEIPTLEGTHQACAGDWVIKGVAGEYYPCKDYIFKQTYEQAYDKDKPSTLEEIKGLLDK
jgi:hypothetical protein